MKGHKRVFKQTTGDAIGGAGAVFNGPFNGTIGAGANLGGGNATSGSNYR
jgi:hypothetical protein